jgi:hypothetical protein
MARDNARIHSEVSLMHGAMSTILGGNKSFLAFRTNMGNLHTDVDLPSEKPPPEED